MPQPVKPAPSAHLLRACALFGIAPDGRRDHARRLARASAVAARLQRLPAGQIAFITGPSGSGKSLILRQLAGRLASAATVVDPKRRRPWRRGTVIDQFHAPVAIAMGHLARAGLADATLLSAHPRDLSEGQRFRLLLALALQGLEIARAGRRGGGVGSVSPHIPAPQRPALLIDEFCSTLDRTSARNIARNLRRCTRGPLRTICAAANDDILEALAPDILIYQPLCAPPMIVARDNGRTALHKPQRDR